MDVFIIVGTTVFCLEHFKNKVNYLENFLAALICGLMYPIILGILLCNIILLLEKINEKINVIRRIDDEVNN
jgi:uncharacterized membrane protein YesL